jgi:hypothetical protein
MRFCTHVPNSNKNKNMKSSNPYLRSKMVFLASKTLLSLSGTVEFIYLFDFERYNLAMVRNECVRFDGHVDIEVSYKILQLEVLKESPILDTSPCF